MKDELLPTYHVIGKFSRRQIGDIFSYFSQKIGFDISCQLSPKETIGMKCQNLFSGKTEKNTSKCCLLNLFPSMQCVNEKV